MNYTSTYNLSPTIFIKVSHEFCLSLLQEPDISQSLKPKSLITAALNCRILRVYNIGLTPELKYVIVSVTSLAKWMFSHFRQLKHCTIKTSTMSIGNQLRTKMVITMSNVLVTRFSRSTARRVRTPLFSEREICPLFSVAALKVT